jgi:hypothetical protein
MLLWGNQSKSFRVLLDSGADESIMDATLASELDIPTQPLSIPMDVGALDGHSMHFEKEHLCEVFSKARATSLLPHRPYDCRIDLLPGTTLSRVRLYSLSGPETTDMETYIVNSQAAGFIRPSASPVSTGFFFVEKKDKTLRPCIDYRGLNDIPVKNHYPLPLISSAFEPLWGATVFSKLDLQNAYHLLRIREGDDCKTAFNISSGHYEYLVMPFGLTKAPAVFQALVNDVLRDMLNQFVIVYHDDIHVFSCSTQEHVLHIRQVRDASSRCGTLTRKLTRRNPAIPCNEPSNRQRVNTGLRLNHNTPAPTLILCSGACKLLQTTKGSTAACCPVTQAYQTS